ncbi:hypothetical protein [Desulfonema magnum]|uniref:hypothetical protein n=1 Tax=Desulfonema magnum TaxID=45655 RepID=UPI001A9B37D8|nr:hypothetical protein [Desulfonema magnum]
MGRSRYKTAPGIRTYFASTAIVNWLPIFAVPELAKIVLDSLQFLHDNQLDEDSCVYPDGESSSSDWLISRIFR